MTVTEYIRSHLLSRLGVHNTMPPLDELRRTEWSSRFEALMRNRLVMGSFRYGRLNASGKAKFNRVACMMRRLKEYQETGNLEHLVDVANLALLEFEEGDHPLRHFHSKDDGKHTDLQ